MSPGAADVARRHSTAARPPSPGSNAATRLIQTQRVVHNLRKNALRNQMGGLTAPSVRRNRTHPGPENSRRRSGELMESSFAESPQTDFRTVLKTPCSTSKNAWNSVAFLQHKDVQLNFDRAPYRRTLQCSP